MSSGEFIYQLGKTSCISSAVLLKVFICIFKIYLKKVSRFQVLGLLIEYFLAHFIPKILEWTSLINYIKIFSVSKILSGVTQLNTVTILNQILNKHNKTTKEPTTTKNKHIKYHKENNQMPQLFFSQVESPAQVNAHNGIIVLNYYRELKHTFPSFYHSCF